MSARTVYDLAVPGLRLRHPITLEVTQAAGRFTVWHEDTHSWSVGWPEDDAVRDCCGSIAYRYWDLKTYAGLLSGRAAEIYATLCGVLVEQTMGAGP